ncbi:hypothetical protein ABT124_04870, partial [Streptomyces sp. NPDC001982]
GLTPSQGGRRIALTAIRLPLPCSAGVRFLPGLKAGASSEEPGDGRASDDILSVIPADPHWQPDRTAAERAAALVRELAPGWPDGIPAETDVDWYDLPDAIDCGANLERIGCPHCGATIDRDWYRDPVEGHPDGFPTLAVHVPCCGTATSLDALDYEWPCGFARFEIAVWNPGRGPLTDHELAAVAQALGSPVRQILAHI